MATDELRVAVLRRLLRLEVPVEDALAELAAYPWDSEELVTVTRGHLARVLAESRGGAMTAAQVVRWAEVVHLRDDIGREPGHEDLVNQALIEMSSPELFGPLASLGLEQRLSPPAAD